MEVSALRRIWLALGWLWVAVVLFLSLTPHPPEPISFPYADKLEHALAYCLLMLWFAQIYGRRMQRLFVAALLVAMGISVEFLQGFGGYRMFEYADMLANSTGVLLGWVWASTALGHMLHALETRFSKME